MKNIRIRIEKNATGKKYKVNATREVQIWSVYATEKKMTPSELELSLKS